MPQDHRKLRPTKKRVTAPVVVVFFLVTEASPPDRITAEDNNYLICELTDLSTNDLPYFDFLAFRFF